MTDLTYTAAKQVTADTAHLGLFPFHLCQKGSGRREGVVEKWVSLLKGFLQVLQIKLALQQSAHSPISKISLGLGALSTSTNAAQLWDSLLISSHHSLPLTHFHLWPWYIADKLQCVHVSFLSLCIPPTNASCSHFIPSSRFLYSQFLWNIVKLLVLPSEERF